MPNWCENKLFLTHDSSQMIDWVNTAFEEGNPFQTLMPCPDDLRETEAIRYTDPEEQAKQTKIEESNRAKHGHKDWYDWCYANWGTKWDASDISVWLKDADSIDVSFSTAWGPALGFYKHLETLGFKVRGAYYEPGVGFIGVYEEGEDSSWKIENAPGDLLEEFGATLDNDD